MNLCFKIIFTCLILLFATIFYYLGDFTFFVRDCHHNCIYNNTKAADSPSRNGGANTSTQKISPSNCFVLGKNPPAYRISTRLRKYNAISTCPTIFSTDFEQNISKLQFYGTLQDRWLLPHMLGDLASFAVGIYRGGERQPAHTMQIPNTYFRQQPANRSHDSDCLQDLKFDHAKLVRLYIVYKFKMLSKKRKLNDGDSSNVRRKKCTAAICWKTW